ncbi:hypothetical protein M011DRAFT_404403 [Sporormia fimetaria CBS 119925]|uniref:CFEM domain-containing protein n=1 Tax=Sporormia fimetaria CBS 119925 TaxID=1340428 RepID=A0A6A6V9Q2_9PLEO|nr:hypothetical protein M011DRAFT_404403 [Sporormia fimetaria CBS 119925]
MKSFVAVATVALASVAHAQLSNLPSCALSCLLPALQSSGCATLTDFECQCGKADALFATALPCVQDGCSEADQATTISAVQGACAEAGVPIEVPGGAEPSAAPTSEAPAPTEAPEETETVTEEVPEETATETVTEEVPEETATETEVVTSVSGVPTPSGNGTSSTAEPTPSEFPGAASRVQAAGLLGAAALAVFAL